MFVGQMPCVLSFGEFAFGANRLSVNWEGRDERCFSRTSRLSGV